MKMNRYCPVLLLYLMLGAESVMCYFLSSLKKCLPQLTDSSIIDNTQLSNQGKSLSDEDSNNDVLTQDKESNIVPNKCIKQHRTTKMYF